MALRRPLGVALVAPLFAIAGCGDESITAIFAGQCSNFTPCQSVDEDPDPSDYVVEWIPREALSLEDPSSSMDSLQAATSGEMVFHTDAPDCFGEPHAPCRMTLKRLTFHMDGWTATLSNGQTLTVDDPTISVVAPIALEDHGEGYVIPKGTSFQTCASIDGQSAGATVRSTASTGSLTLQFQAATHIVYVTGAFPMLLHANDSACSALPFTVDATLEPQTPWKQKPSR